MTSTTKTSEETEALAKGLVGQMLNNKIVHLYGALGSGKTTFVKGLAKALGIKKAVKSPTYTYLNSYSLPTPDSELQNLCHFDLYRLPEQSENPHQTAAEIGLEDALKNPKNLVVIEWPERLPISEKGLHISFEKREQDHLIVVSETKPPAAS